MYKIKERLFLINRFSFSLSLTLTIKKYNYIYFV